jgi:hypothetical protein
MSSTVEGGPVGEQQLHSAVAGLVGTLLFKGGVLNTGAAAKRLHSEYPDCGSAPSQIADMLARRAIAAGVPIQFTPAD